MPNIPVNVYVVQTLRNGAKRHKDQLIFSRDDKGGAIKALTAIAGPYGDPSTQWRLIFRDEKLVETTEMVC